MKSDWEPFNESGTMCPPDPELVDEIMAKYPLKEEPMWMHWVVPFGTFVAGWLMSWGLLKRKASSKK